MYLKIDFLSCLEVVVALLTCSLIRLIQPYIKRAHRNRMTTISSKYHRQPYDRRPRIPTAKMRTYEDTFSGDRIYPGKVMLPTLGVAMSRYRGVKSGDNLLQTGEGSQTSISRLSTLSFSS